MGVFIALLVFAMLGSLAEKVLRGTARVRRWGVNRTAKGASPGWVGAQR